MKSPVIITIALALVLSSSNLFAGTVPTGDAAYHKYLKEQISKQLNFDQDLSDVSCCQVDVTIYVNSDSYPTITFIDGDDELCEYVHANIEQMEIEHPDMRGKSFNITLDFNKQLATL